MLGSFEEAEDVVQHRGNDASTSAFRNGVRSRRSSSSEPPPGGPGRRSAAAVRLTAGRGRRSRRPPTPARRAAGRRARDRRGRSRCSPSRGARSHAPSARTSLVFLRTSVRDAGETGRVMPLLVVDAANVVGVVPDGWWRRRRGQPRWVERSPAEVGGGGAAHCRVPEGNPSGGAAKASGTSRRAPARSDTFSEAAPAGGCSASEVSSAMHNRLASTRPISSCPPPRPRPPPLGYPIDTPSPSTPTTTRQMTLH